MQAAVTSSSVWRPRGETGEGWQMQFTGEGFVVVQPAELMPPYDALAGTGMAERFGLGQARLRPETTRSARFGGGR